MAGTVTNNPPGRVGPIGDGWTLELDAIPHSPADGSGSTGVVNFSAASSATSLLTMNNLSTFTYTMPYQTTPGAIAAGTAGGYGATPYNSAGYSGGTGAAGSSGYGSGPYNGYGYAIGSSAPTGTGVGYGNYGDGLYGGGTTANTTVAGGWTTTYGVPNPNVVTGTITGRIDSVSVQGAKASYTQSTPFTQFATSDIKIPAVTSGSPLAAFLLAWQLAGNNPCNLVNTTGTYWPLRGHDVGFDSNNKAVTPQDKSSYYVIGSGSAYKTYRRWEVVNSFAATGWEYHENEMWATSGTGSSPKVGARERTIIMGTINLDSPFSFVMGTDSTNVGFGPDDSQSGFGKYFSVNVTTSTLTITGAVRAGGAYTPVSRSTPMTGVDSSKPVQVLIDLSYPSASGFAITVTVRNLVTTNAPVTLTTGTIATAVDNFAAPWSFTGYLHGVYQLFTTASFQSSSLLGPYETIVPVTTDLDSAGISTPILPMSGSLWDYLTQVFTARSTDLRVISNGYSITAMLDNSPTSHSWFPVASPTITVDNSNTAETVEVDAQLTTFGKQPLIYDALLDGNATQSFDPGTTTTFTLTTTSVNSLIFNPEPLYDVTDFLDGNHPFGAYIVTGPDNLPIVPAEWITFGGRVSVEQTDINTVTVTVVCPAGLVQTTGSFSLSVSDGSNSYGMLKLCAASGGQTLAESMIYQTGANGFSGLALYESNNLGYASAPNSSGSTITNVAATNLTAVQNIAAWAVLECTGPNLQLSGEFPLTDLEDWSTPDLGFIPGATLLYENLQWRILTATVSNTSVQFTATPFVCYGNTYFDQNWAQSTVDDFADYWDGKTYDDMAVMPLSGPISDWSNRGAISKFAVFPSEAAGTTIDDVLPGNPNANSATPTATILATYPQANTYPGSKVNQG